MKKIMLALAIILICAVSVQAYVVSPINVKEVWTYQRTLTYQVQPIMPTPMIIPSYGYRQPYNPYMFYNFYNWYPYNFYGYYPWFW